MKVHPTSGLFFFGPEYRPVPLDTTLLGVTEKQRVKRNDMMNRLANDRLVTALERGKQVMIFVHSRKDASRTADAMRDLCAKGGTTNLLENVHHEQYGVWKRAVEKSRSQEVQQLFYHGLGVHHAGTYCTAVISRSSSSLSPPPLFGHACLSLPPRGCTPVTRISNGLSSLPPLSLPKPLH